MFFLSVLHFSTFSLHQKIAFGETKIKTSRTFKLLFLQVKQKLAKMSHTKLGRNV